MTQKSIHIIGAGIARLSAICYEQMNGYQAQIFELHDRPGGMVTAWTRHGYRVDGCIEFLNGSRFGTRFHRLWQELGAVQGRTFVDHDELFRVRGQDGQELVLYGDLKNGGSSLGNFPGRQGFDPRVRWCHPRHDNWM